LKTFDDIDAANELLEAYRGAKAQIWMYHVSLQRLALRLSWPKEDNAVYLVAAGCEHITGSFSWTVHGLCIQSIRNEGVTLRTKITDEKASFELLCSGGFVMMQGAEKELADLLSKFYWY
jgi:hypothetical protein